MAEPTVHDISRRQDESTAATQRLTEALDRLSTRIDALPDSIDKTYVRKDVANERAQRVDAALASLASSLREHAEQTEAKFDRVANTTRWFVGIVLIPIGLAVIAILSANGGFK